MVFCVINAYLILRQYSANTVAKYWTNILLA